MGGAGVGPRLLCLRRQMHAVTVVAISNTAPPTEPPTIAPMLVFFPGCGGIVGIGAAVAVGRYRVAVRGAYEALAPKYTETLLSFQPRSGAFLVAAPCGLSTLSRLANECIRKKDITYVPPTTSTIAGGTRYSVTLGMYSYHFAFVASCCPRLRLCCPWMSGTSQSTEFVKLPPITSICEFLITLQVSEPCGEEGPGASGYHLIHSKAGMVRMYTSSNPCISSEKTSKAAGSYLRLRSLQSQIHHRCSYFQNQQIFWKDQPNSHVVRRLILSPCCSAT